MHPDKQDLVNQDRRPAVWTDGRSLLVSIILLIVVLVVTYLLLPKSAAPFVYEFF